MNNKTLKDVYTLLKDIGAISNESEFSKEWLGKSECYMRLIRHKRTQPSDGVMAVVASKLNHYGNKMKQSTEHKRLGERFIQLSNSCHQSIEENAFAKWKKIA